jgi:hypothetical protein
LTHTICFRSLDGMGTVGGDVFGFYGMRSWSNAPFARDLF